MINMEAFGNLVGAGSYGYTVRNSSIFIICAHTREP
jgi:hypothetical protein